MYWDCPPAIWSDPIEIYPKAQRSVFWRNIFIVIIFIFCVLYHLCYCRPEARWGTQEMLTPPSDAAKKAVATPRVELLARPKNDFRENPSKLVQFLYRYVIFTQKGISMVK